MISIENDTLNPWEIVTAISTLIMAIAAILALSAYSTARKSQYLSTIESCSKEFRKYMRKIQEENPPETIKRDLLGLFHKQLFYIKHNYVPLNIKIEWIKTTHFVVRENILFKDDLSKSGLPTKEFEESDWERSFDRVREFYNYKKNNDDDSPNVKMVNKRIIKHYRKTYFNRRQRLFLTWNRDWKNAFIIIGNSIL